LSTFTRTKKWIYTGSRKRATRAPEQETEGEQQWKTVSWNREKIVISKKAGDKPVTYAELLRKMQHTVKVHDIDIKIKNVRETKGGNIEITTTGKEEVKDAFIKRIQEKKIVYSCRIFGISELQTV
jgi:hypothetical protein